MTFVRAVRALATLLTAVVFVVSGTYLIVYLYRWEWNRALLAGLFFVAAEVALVGWAVLARLRALGAARPPAADVAPVAAPAPPRERTFAWLHEDAVGVFIPVLLGAGVVLSALSYLVEHLSRWTSRPAEVVTVRLGAVAPRPGGLSGRPLALGPPVTRSPRRPIVIALLAVFGVVLTWSAIDAVADLTQSRPELERPAASTTVELRVARRSGPSTPALTAEALWIACRPAVPGWRGIDGQVLSTTGDVATLVLRPGLGSLGERRLRGCLEDALLSRVQGTVLSMRSAP